MSTSTGLPNASLGSLVGDVVPRHDVVIATKAASRPGTERRFDASKGYLLAVARRLAAPAGHRLRRPLAVSCVGSAHPDRRDAVGRRRGGPVGQGQVRRRLELLRVADRMGLRLAGRVPGTGAARGQPDGVLAAATGRRTRGRHRRCTRRAPACWPGRPLGRGVLTGKYRGGTPSDSRAASEHFTDFVRPFMDDRCRQIVEAVVTAASGLGVAPLEVALAWVRDQPGVTSTIVGARTAAQLLGSLAAETLELPARDRRRAR